MKPERLVLDTDIVIPLLKKQPAIVAAFIALLEAQSTFLLSPGNCLAVIRRISVESVKHSNAGSQTTQHNEEKGK